MRRLLFFCVIAVLVGGWVAAGAQAPKTVLLDGASLLRAKEQKSAEVLRAVKAAADKAMSAPSHSVMDKTQVPPSGDKHDYMSLAPYFWPNPDTPNHLPYVRHDGKHNPEAEAVKDHEDMNNMAADVRSLALAYYLTGDDAYAKKAAADLHVWFLDPATKMNPNLRFAQAVLGVNDGRGTGILEAKVLTDVVDGLALLAGSKEWTAADESGLHAWMDAYFTWLTTSKNGKDEAAAKNNHGTWDDVQEGVIALYLGKKDFVKSLVEAAKAKRIGLQIQANGELPLEEARTRSFSYSVFDLTALMELATLANDADLDLWSYKAPGGGSIRDALNFLLPFAEGAPGWKHENIEGLNGDILRWPLLKAAVVYKNASYEAAALKMKGKDKDDAEQVLLEWEFAQAVKGQ